MYIDEIKTEYIENGVAAEIVRCIMDAELNQDPEIMRTDVVDCCLDILTELKSYNET